MLLPSVLNSYLPFELGFFVWSLGFIALAAWLLRRSGLSWPVILAGLLSPAALWNTELGQLGVIGDVILVAGLFLAGTAPWRGGALLGVLSFKPQIGLLVPAFFVGQRNWRAACGFAAICVGLAGLSLTLFGGEALGAISFGRPESDDGGA